MSTDPLDNDGRAGFAATALMAYHAETHPSSSGYGDEDSEQFVETFSDLLGDLQHLASRAGADFQELLERGTYHFTEEVQEEEEAARQEEERIRQENAPLDEKVYAAVNGDFHHFAKFRETCGIPVPELRRSLLRLLEQGKIEQVYGKGWRRVTVPLEDRVLSWLSEDKRTMQSSIEVDHGIEEDRLRACLNKLRDAGLIKATEGGWVRVASNG